MLQIDVKEFCNTINRGTYYITGFEWKREYSYEEDCIQTALILTFCEGLNPVVEKLIKAKFYGVQKLHCDEIFNSIFGTVIQVEDISDRGYENIRYYVNEVEGNFHFYCEDVSIFMTTL